MDVPPCAQSGAVHFLSMGRLSPEKAIDQTIRAFGTLEAEKPARLTILGDGPCRDELEALSRQLGQDGRITFAGSVTDVTPYLRRADVYLSTSVAEGMSNALLEAMSHGMVSLVSRVSGVADVVDEERSGLLFPPGDERALATRLEEALNMPLERRSELGDAARATIRARFALDEVADRHLELYRRLMKVGARVREAR